ncbi:hypothetical protein Hdeb2414_s0002g00055911 [Helianthus debilis subsp. tardiflorus]
MNSNGDYKQRRESKRAEKRERTAADGVGGDGDGVRRRWSETQTGRCVLDQWYVSRTGGLCHSPAVGVSIRWFVSLSDEFMVDGFVRVSSRPVSVRVSRHGSARVTAWSLWSDMNLGLTRVNSGQQIQLSQQLSRLGSRFKFRGSVRLTRSNRVKPGQLGETWSTQRVDSVNPACQLS